MFNCFPCNYIHWTDVSCKFQMQVADNFLNLTALQHVMLMAIDKHLNSSPLFTMSNHMTFYKKKYFSYFNGHSSQLFYVQVNSTKFYLWKHFFQKLTFIFHISAVKFVLQSVHESNAVLNVRQEEISTTVVKYIPQNQTLSVGYST